MGKWGGQKLHSKWGNGGGQKLYSKWGNGGGGVKDFTLNGEMGGRPATVPHHARLL